MGAASDVYADLTRQQWQNYVSAYMPIENKIINYAMDTTEPQQAAQTASADVQAAYAAQQGATQRKLQGLGVTLSPEEQAASQRQTGLSQALADVNAQNVARAQTTAMQQSILGNPAPTALLNKQGV